VALTASERVHLAAVFPSIPAGPVTLAFDSLHIGLIADKQFLIAERESCPVYKEKENKFKKRGGSLFIHLFIFMISCSIPVNVF